MKNKLERRWVYGFVVYENRNSSDYTLINEETLKVVVARSIQRTPPSDKWRPEGLSTITSTPQTIAVPKDPRVNFAPPPADVDGTAAGRKRVRDDLGQAETVRHFACIHACLPVVHDVADYVVVALCALSPSIHSQLKMGGGV